jgi:hypothetical protein
LKRSWPLTARSAGSAVLSLAEEMYLWLTIEANSSPPCSLGFWRCRVGKLVF